NHSCAIVDGGVQCWGWGEVLGHGDPPSNESTPVDVLDISNATDIAAGYDFTCAIDAGAAKCWGDNSSGQIGVEGLLLYFHKPQPVTGLGSGVTAISVGQASACAIVSGGAMCWGDNTQGQLGNGTYDSGYVPLPVIGLERGVLAIFMGGAHTCALTTQGPRCWGSNQFGELGAGISAMNSPIPVPVVVLPERILSFALNSYYTCAVVENGGVCWGQNSTGQLGNGGIPWLPLPQAVTEGPIFANGFE
ncbi:MAG TPA: hypothetical protein VGO25_08485, partial [Rhodanobacteraceae bacterium]|nr:hypothetical protein [Rhodanobacteraceae bacterium]